MPLNMCLAVNGGTLAGGANESDRDASSGESHGFRYNVSGSGSADCYIYFPKCHVQYCRLNSGGDGNAGYAWSYFYLLVDGSWVTTGLPQNYRAGNPGWSWSVSYSTYYDNGGAGWNNVTGIRHYIGAVATGGVSRAYTNGFEAWGNPSGPFITFHKT